MLEVTLLGQFEVLHDGERLTIPTRNAQSLFAYLILNAGKAYRREKLAGLLWPDSSEENARSNLRHELWRLRKALKTTGESYFLIDDLTIAFSSKSEFSLDVQMLESVPSRSGSAGELIGALSAYQGELLPGFYDEWVFVERDRLHGLFEAGMTRLLEILGAEGHWAEVVDWAMRWIAQGGWPEPAYQALMTAYANRGDVSKAMATYQRFTQGVQEDLGLMPSEHTQGLYKRLKAGWKSETQAQTPLATADVSIVPGGKAEPAVPLPRVRRSNLPRPLTSFIGREVEIQQVEQLVSDARLVTITGTGGVGKTRLAIRVADTLASQFRDGVWWVELAALSVMPPFQGSRSEALTGRQGALTGADLVAQVIAKTLRIPESPGLPLLEGVIEYLYDKQLLLGLDNCEHLIAACAALVERVLGDCPEVSILATSREPLRVPGEKAWYLPSLSLPEAGLSPEFNRIVQSEAVSLFIDRAADILPGYQLVEAEATSIAQICLRLDGIPLAIELAAARMNLLSTQEIATRLGSRFDLLTAGRRTALPRHQTLRAAIEWSYDLLNDEERVFFRRLSVFSGNFTLEAAEDVCAGEGIQRGDVLTLLGRLVDKSLLNVDPSLQDLELATRYRLLDTICSFGRMELDEVGETRRLHDRHAAYYVRLVEAVEPKLLLQDQGRWYRLLQAEMHNIRTVIDWSVESDQAEGALRVVGALLWFWWSHGSIHEGLDLALKALALPSAGQHPEFRARAFNTAGYLQWSLGDITSARQSLDEILSIIATSNYGTDETSLAWWLQFLGLVLASEGHYDLADDSLQEGIAMARKLGELNKSSFSLAFHGDIAIQQGDNVKAKSIYEESTNLLRALGNKLFVGYTVRRLGYLALEENEIPCARDYFRESLALNREGGDRRAVAACLVSFAALAIRLDQPVVAARLLGAVESRLESLGINLLYLDQIELGRVSGNLLKILDDDLFKSALSEGWELSEDQAVELVGEIFGGNSDRGVENPWGLL